MKTHRCLLAIISCATLSGCMTTVPEGALLACQNGIVEWAEQYHPLRIDTVSSGLGELDAQGTMVAPLHVRIVYARRGGRETREADIECTVNEKGAVVAVMDR